MKNLYYTVTLIIVLILSGCSFEKNRTPDCQHEYLIHFINESSYYKKFNNCTQIDSHIVSLLKENIEIDSLIEISFDEIKIDKVDTLDAKYYHTVYKNRREYLTSVVTPGPNDTFKLANDRSDAIIIPFKKINVAMNHFFPEELNDFSKWDDIGFVVYFGNYGRIGKRRLEPNEENPTYNSSILIQLARKNQVQWEALRGEIYNFGGLKPPMEVSNELIMD